MVVLPTGRFRMGSPADEGPLHTVTISRPIAMGQYPVTFEDYDRFVAAAEGWGFLKTLFGKKLERPNDRGWGRGSRPVIDVSWHGAKAYAAWLSEQTGKRYRLPSESEWEYAARAGTETAYSWGDSINCSQACYGHWPYSYGEAGECSDSWHGTSPVGSFEPNAFGLYDMHGNVNEWVEDCWHCNYEGAPSDGSAWTSGGNGSNTNERILRGGSWATSSEQLRSAYRNCTLPSSRGSARGFRLVQDLNP